MNSLLNFSNVKQNPSIESSNWFRFHIGYSIVFHAPNKKNSKYSHNFASLRFWLHGFGFQTRWVPKHRPNCHSQVVAPKLVTEPRPPKNAQVSGCRFGDYFLNGFFGTVEPDGALFLVRLYLESTIAGDKSTAFSWSTRLPGNL